MDSRGTGDGEGEAILDKDIFVKEKKQVSCFEKKVPEDKLLGKRGLNRGGKKTTMYTHIFTPLPWFISFYFSFLRFVSYSEK